ncbi:MAG TPA: hypothetical protein VF139_19315 [Candidatus Polarisedimenticolaceae bacterium]
MRRTILSAMAVLMLAAPVRATGEERWLHIHVDEGADGDRVRVNVPLSMLEQILPAIHVENFRGGRIRIDGADMNDVDLQAIGRALRAAQDGEFVKVNSRHDGDVTVSKQGGMILVRVDEKGEGAERVRVRVPLAFMDALLAPGGGEIDVAAAMKALSDAGEGELVTVESANEKVRIWVDRTAASAE